MRQQDRSEPSSVSSKECCGYAAEYRGWVVIPFPGSEAAVIFEPNSLFIPMVFINVSPSG